jgi:hypothetical protein
LLHMEGVLVEHVVTPLLVGVASWKAAGVLVASW